MKKNMVMFFFMFFFMFIFMFFSLQKKHEKKHDHVFFWNLIISKITIESPKYLQKKHDLRECNLEITSKKTWFRIEQSQNVFKKNMKNLANLACFFLSFFSCFFNDHVILQSRGTCICLYIRNIWKMQFSTT